MKRRVRRRRAVKITDYNSLYRQFKQATGDVNRLKALFRDMARQMPREVEASFEGDSIEAFKELLDILRWAEGQIRNIHDKRPY